MAFRSLKKLNYFQIRQIHHSVLPSDLFEGKTIVKSRVIKQLESNGPTLYGGRNIVTMIPGIKPGPKLMSHVKEIFKEAFVPVDFEEIQFDGSEDEEQSEAFGKQAIASMHRNGAGIKGNIANPNLLVSPNVSLRSELDLYVCLVHVKGYKNVQCKYPNIDCVICRQNTEGEYSLLEHESKTGIVESYKIITEENTSRFAEWCFEFAVKENRKKITIVHKANIMKLSDGLFMKVVKDVAKNYPQITINDMIVDNCTMQIVQNPMQFDMIVTPNLYGNILSNIAIGLVGGPGLMAGRNYGDNCALFEVGSRHLMSSDNENPNPIAMLNASTDLLYYLGKENHANLIRAAINETLSKDKIQTKDLGGENTPEEMIDSIKCNIRKLLKSFDIKRF